MRVDAIEGARRILNGEVVGFQTETLFGLGADPSNFSAVSRIADIKSRDLGAGIPLIAIDSKIVVPWLATETSTQVALRTALQERFWPGPLTLVLATNKSARLKIAPEVFGADLSIAVRVSSGKVAQDLANRVGGVLTATSANPRGEPPAKNIQEFEAYFPELAVVGGEEPNQLSEMLPSTLVSLLSDNVKILREGAISSKAIFDCIGIGRSGA